MHEALLEKRIDQLEQALMELVYQSRKTEMAIEKLAEENRKLALEMKEFKDEMREFKNEMREFKNEMREFKDEMKEFKDEMLNFKREQQEENKRKNKEWSNLAKKMGTIVEDLIAPALRPVLSKYFNCEVEMIGQRILKRIKGEDYEVDAVAACEDLVFMIEVKSTPYARDVEDIKKKSKRFFEFFPEFKNKQLIVIFASITFPEQIVKKGKQKQDLCYGVERVGIHGYLKF